MKKKLIALFTLVCLAIGLFVPENLTEAAAHKCSYADKNIESVQFLVFYDKNGKAEHIQQRYLDGKKQVKYWSNPKEYFTTEDLGNHFSRQIITKYARDIVNNKESDFSYAIVKKNYKVNGKNYRGYYAVPFRLYGNLNMYCPTCKKAAVTTTKIVYKGIVFIKPNGKKQATVADCILLSSTALSKNNIKAKKNISRAEADDYSHTSIYNAISKSRWKPF